MLSRDHNILWLPESNGYPTLLYLQRLWESLAKLPAVFPDGTPLDEKVYPWLPNSLVSSHFVLLREQRPVLSGLQSLISIALAYWFVPLTLVMGIHLTQVF